VLNELALFAGGGGGILGSILLGWRTVCAVEIDPYCREVLLSRQRDGCLEPFPIWDDIKTFEGRPWRGHVDVVTGGFPCQDISAAGRGDGIEGSKSSLWFEMARVVREVQPRYVLVENSPMLTTRGLGRVLGDLASMGFDARWGVFSACSMGAPHMRRRMFIVANANGFNGKKRVRVFEELETLSKRSYLLRREWLESISRAKRGRHGVAHVMDRLKAIGNGQVPRVVVLAWEVLSDGMCL
jgi:DNA (cytosine-5)-methyltransferase 1